MLLKTEGIVLHSLKYSDTSLISRVYTEEVGLVSYIIKGARRAKGKANLFNPPSILDLVVYNRSNKKLQNIKEVKIAYIFTSLPFEIVKSSIAMFMIELLNKCIREEEANKIKFEFIKQSFIYIDSVDKGLQLFPAWFMVNLASFLGFEPGRNPGMNAYFDLKHGIFVHDFPDHSYFMDGKSSNWLARLMECNVEHLQELQISNMERKTLINHLISYYQHHVEGFGKLKSYAVLENVLS